MNDCKAHAKSGMYTHLTTAHPLLQWECDWHSCSAQLWDARSTRSGGHGVQIVVATLMNLCDDPTRVAGQGNWREMDTIRRIPIVVTGEVLCLSTSRVHTSRGNTCQGCRVVVQSAGSCPPPQRSFRLFPFASVGVVFINSLHSLQLV